MRFLALSALAATAAANWNDLHARGARGAIDSSGCDSLLADRCRSHPETMSARLRSVLRDGTLRRLGPLRAPVSQASAARLLAAAPALLTLPSISLLRS